MRRQHGTATVLGFGVGFAVLLLAASTAVEARYVRDPHGRYIAPDQFRYHGDQRGCYWAEGRRYCSRYCYWEVDGLRYCRTDRRRAHPQGDPWFQPYPPEPPIYPRFWRQR